MIIDLSSFIGSWPSHPVMGQPEQVWGGLRELGVSRIFASHLHSVWCRNPHVDNDALYHVAHQTDDVWPVPVIDPTVADWQKELARAKKQDRVKLVRLFPNYGGYALSDVGDFLQAISDAGLGVIVQTCMEDPRRQHPLSVVPNLTAVSVVDVAENHTHLRMVIGGAKAGEIRALKNRLLALPHLYVDVSQVDGMDAVKVLVDEGLGEKLIFGSHAPLMIPLASLGRFVPDLDDKVLSQILAGNALLLLGERERK